MGCVFFKPSRAESPTSPLCTVESSSAGPSDEPPPIRAPPPIRIARQFDFESNCAQAKQFLPSRSQKPVALPESIGRGEGFEKALREALVALAHCTIPDQRSERVWQRNGRSGTNGFHMGHGTWWPQSLPTLFWADVSHEPPTHASPDAQPSAPEQALRKGSERDAAYEAAETRWHGDQGNPFAAFLVHSSHMSAREDGAAVEAARAAALATACAAADAYADADASGRDGIVDWSRVDPEATQLAERQARHEGLRRLSMGRPTKGPRASLRPVQPGLATAATSAASLVSPTHDRPSGINRHAYQAGGGSGAAQGGVHGGGGGADGGGGGGSGSGGHDELDTSALEGFLTSADHLCTHDAHDAGASGLEAAAVADEASPTTAKKKKKKKAGGGQTPKRLSSIEIPLWAKQALGQLDD